ncbi:TolC family protein [Kovacikia minuta CCNUW1]|uniref:TolC family protein n=1 Tax=Kovacikia minuta TaxID=2931930 RepID=UPI001CCF2C4E|nr:TolC family protein [Kovacikia minuta]UBF25431.1 TolC family protein [Kovacikia minuta CCNUW1]
MRLSLRLVFVCVGVWVALGNILSGNAESIPEQPQNSTKASQPQATSSPKRWLQAVQQKLSSNTESEMGGNSAVSPPVSGALQKLNFSIPTVSTAKINAARELSTAPPSPASTRRLPALTASPSQIKQPLKQPSTVKAFLNSPQGTRVAQQPASPTTIPNQPSSGFSPNPLTEPVIEPLGQPLGPAKPGRAPEYLNPDPNPLSFPTKPEEVKLRGIQPITLNQALELAERNNRTLQIAGITVNRSRSALTQAEAELFPTLDFSSAVSRSESASGRLSDRNSSGNSLARLLGLDSGGSSGVSRSFNSDLTLSYDVFTSGGRPARIRAAAQQLRSDQLAYEITLESLRLTIANAYYDLQQADAQVRIGQASVRNSQISLRDAQALERAGLGTRFDTLQAQVTLANSQQTLTNAIAQQQIARRQLAQLLSIAPSADLAAADPVAAAGRWNLSLEETIVLAFKNRAELEQQLAQRELAHQQKLAALSALGPTLSVSAQYNVLNSFGVAGSGGWADGYNVQAGLSWRLFDGGAARASASQQEANIAIAEENFADQRDQIRFAVEQAYANLSSNQVNISTAQTGLVQAQEALRLARLRFQAGVGTQTDVINSETALTNAQGNVVSAILGYNRALASLQRAVTNLPIATGATTPYVPDPSPPPGISNLTPSTGTSTPSTGTPTPSIGTPLPSTITPPTSPGTGTTPP